MSVSCAEIISGPFSISFDGTAFQLSWESTNEKHSVLDTIRIVMETGNRFQKYIQYCVALVKHIFLVCPNIVSSAWSDDKLRMHEWVAALDPECAMEIYRVVDPSTSHDKKIDAVFDVFPFEMYSWVASQNHDYAIFVVSESYGGLPMIKIGHVPHLHTSFWQKCNPYSNSNGCHTYEVSLADMMMHYMPICDDDDFREACLRMIGQFRFQEDTDFAKLLVGNASQHAYDRLVIPNAQTSLALTSPSEASSSVVKYRNTRKRVRKDPPPQEILEPETDESSSSSSSENDEVSDDDYEDDEDAVGNDGPSLKPVVNGPKGNSWVVKSYNPNVNSAYCIVIHESDDMPFHHGMNRIAPPIMEAYNEMMNLILKRADSKKIIYLGNYLWTLTQLARSKVVVTGRLESIITIAGRDEDEHGDVAFLTPFVYYTSVKRRQANHFPLYIWYDTEQGKFMPHLFCITSTNPKIKNTDQTYIDSIYKSIPFKSF